MKIAVNLGFAPSQVRQWPRSDIIDLIAYDRLQPYGNERDNWHAAMQARLFVSANLKKGARLPDLKEFMYSLPEEKAISSQIKFTSWLSAKAAKNGNN